VSNELTHAQACVQSEQLLVIAGRQVAVALVLAKIRNGAI